MVWKKGRGSVPPTLPGGGGGGLRCCGETLELLAVESALAAELS